MVYQEVITDKKRVMEMRHGIVGYPREASHLSKDLKEVTWQAMWLWGGKASLVKGPVVQMP